jgi:dihydroorotase-like cyclic amidohydrolase
MWRLLRAGTLTHISSDHAPSTLEQKRAGDIWNVHFGLPGLDSTFALLLDAAAGWAPTERGEVGCGHGP